MAKVVKNNRILVLFDVDGTLTVARKEGTPDIFELLEKLRERVTIGFVGGSDLPKQIEQLGSDVLNKFDYCFPQNGVEGYKDGELFVRKSFNEFLGEEKMSKLINGLLGYMAKLELPVKRGTFIEYRQGMLNVSPIGRNCSRSERNDYEKFDLANNIRKDFVKWVDANYGDYGLKASIGGQISFDLFPIGWDKTLCLTHFEEGQFDEIHFFGDKTYEGGNDFEIFQDPRTIGHTVKSPEDTKRICHELFLKDLAGVEPAPTTKFADILAAGAKEGHELDPLVVAYTMGFAAAAGLN